MIKPQRILTASAQRGGVTLIELLIVVAMFTTLAAIALPTLRDVIREQKVSRAANAVQSYIDAARAKAIGDGRPYGVIIERANSNSPVNRSQSVQLRFAYGPPAYSGDVAGAVAIVLESGNLTFSPAHAPTLVAAARQATSGTTRDPIVQGGDTIRLGPTGSSLNILGIRFADSDDFWLDSKFPEQRENPGIVPNGWPAAKPTDSQVASWPILTFNAIDAQRIRSIYNVGTSLRFSIDRQPRPSLRAPLELVTGTAIDLLYSGVGLSGWQFSPFAIEQDLSSTSPVIAASDRDYRPITIMFNSQGSLSEIRGGALSGGGGSAVVETTSRPTSNIYFLVGKTGGVVPTAPLTEDESAVPNILDTESIWVVINRQTGEVYTATVDPQLRGADDAVTIAGATLSEQLTNAVMTSRQSVANYFTES